MIRGIPCPAKALALVLGLVAWTAPAAGQDAANPHGPLPGSLDCSACHTPSAWTPLRSTLDFRHGAASGFTLSGAHETAACAQCHLDLRFDAPEVGSDECASCHLDVHQGRMLLECADCHDTRSFRVDDGERLHARTSFPLTGAHLQVTCASCHTDDVGGAFAGLDTECVSCHLEDYRSAVTVDHEAAGYPTDCTECHGTVAWGDAPLFDHGVVADGFELVGAHQALRCASCHAVPEMTVHWDPAGPEDCVACHQDEYQEEHGGSSIPTTCLDCHSVDTWDDPDFDHALTGFGLVGAHEGMSCASCHTDDGGGALRFPEPASQDDCVACHQADYDEEHAGSGFPTTCLECHTPTRWEGASFDHALTGFGLVGAHASTACTSCHAVPGYVLLFPPPAGQNDCASCHQPDYDAAHGGSGFPTGCTACHGQSSWASSFDHDAQYFPIYRGKHQEAWSDCVQCHPSPGDFGAFTCLSCHEHARAETDDDHDEVDGYVYESGACLSCHPRGDS